LRENAAELRDIGGKLIAKNDHDLATGIYKRLLKHAPGSVHADICHAVDEGDLFAIFCLVKLGEGDVNGEWG
jgi:hypothetical protein